MKIAYGRGLDPGYEQKRFSREEREGNLRCVASPDGKAGSLTIHQDVNLYSAILKPKQTIEDRIQRGRGAWVQVVRGVLSVNAQVLSTGAAPHSTEEVPWSWNPPWRSPVRKTGPKFWFLTCDEV